jgi:glucokinase
MEYVLAVDIGGTKLAAAPVDSDGGVGEVRTRATPARKGAPSVITAVIALCREVVATMPDDDLRAVGVGAAGVVDVPRGRVVSSTDTLSGWAGTPLRDLLADGLHAALGIRVPLHVQNDADAHLLGEAWTGVAAGVADVLLVAIGTGVGASVLIGGAVHRGAHHVAGEFGHIPIAGAQGLYCPCGREGHLEALASGTGLHRRYQQLGGDPSVADARGVVARSNGGDAMARAALQDAGAALGRGIAASLTMLDPDLVVLTGGFVSVGGSWLDAVRNTVEAQVITPLAHTPLLVGSLGGHAPLVGAAASAWQLTEETT